MNDEQRPTRVPGAAQGAEPGATLYTGSIRRGFEDGIIVGTLRDQWGWTIELYGTRAADGSYTLTGRLGEVPAAFRIPAIDGDAP